MLLMCGFFSFFLLPASSASGLALFYYYTSNSVKPTRTFTHMCMDLCMRNLRVMPICNNIVLFTFFGIEQSHTHTYYCSFYLSVQLSVFFVYRPLSWRPVCLMSHGDAEALLLSTGLPAHMLQILQQCP